MTFQWHYFYFLVALLGFFTEVNPLFTLFSDHVGAILQILVVLPLIATAILVISTNCPVKNGPRWSIIDFLVTTTA